MTFRIALCFLLLGIISPIHAQFGPTQTVSIPMRDGQSLAADIYIPDGCSECPTILIQTPYNKNMFHAGLPLGYLQNLNSSPYSWVIVDWRGFYASSAAMVAQPNRGEDGYDVIEWITQQSWSNGKVGTWGASALGVIQYQTAREQHPAHVCAVPLVAHPQTHYQGYFYGGALEKSRLFTMDALGYGLSPIILANPYFNPTWQFTENSTWYPTQIAIPTLQIGGWYDHNIDKMIDWYQAVRSQSPVNVRDKHRLLVGPWVHGGTGFAFVGSAQQGELEYSDAALESTVRAREFFEFYLLDQANGLEDSPKVKLYETSRSSWFTTNSANFAFTQSSTLHLHESNFLHSSLGISQTSFPVDPKNPSPTIGGQTLSLSLDQGPYDQSELETRNDVIWFESNFLGSDFHVNGRVKVHLFVQSETPDADVVVRLVDHYPDGRNMLINDGIKRLRFRNGYTQAAEAFMTPGITYEAVIDLPFVNYTWQSGHRIKIYVSGNSHSRWDVNLQNGGTMYTAGDTLTNTLTIVHNAANPSRIVFPGSAPVVSVANQETLAALQLPYPNPAQHEIHVDHRFTGSEYQLIDLTGRVVQSGKLTSTSVDLSKVATGHYWLHLTKGEEHGRFAVAVGR